MTRSLWRVALLLLVAGAAQASGGAEDEGSQQTTTRWSGCLGEGLGNAPAAIRQGRPGMAQNPDGVSADLTPTASGDQPLRSATQQRVGGRPRPAQRPGRFNPIP